MSNGERFSQRRGHATRASEIRIRDDAPPEVRGALLQIALDVGLRPSEFRQVICRVLRVAPSDSNWSEFPNVWSEVEGLMHSCEWFRVYDIVEALDRYTARTRPDITDAFRREVNQYFHEAGVGWQLIDGQLEIRGPEPFEASARGTAEALSAQGRSTAATEFHEALLDLSRRPDPDTTGAVQHAMAALECVARDVTGDTTATLGRILQRHQRIVPPPLDGALERLWGFASNRARHLQEGAPVGRAEAELVVAIAGAIASYLSRS